MTAAELIFDAYKSRTTQLEKALDMLVNLLDALESGEDVDAVTQIAKEYVLTEAPLALLKSADDR